jgi:beta-galactosidase
VYEVADKYGIIVAEEVPVIKSRDYSAEVHDQQIKEMIRRDRNHAGIMFWSLGNLNNISISKSILAEDTTRTIITNSILSDSAITYFGKIKKSTVIDSQSARSGEPARIVLSGSQKKLVADRGAVAIVTADIVDSQGIHVSGATNTIVWRIAGPAILAGPSVFVSDINKHDNLEGTWYVDMPVSNVLRSTGKSGKIHISVFASGLASGSFDIEAEEIKPDNSVVVEPGLRDEGRKPVERIELNVQRLEEVPQEMRMISQDFNPGIPGKSLLAKTIKEFIYKNNPSLDTTTIEFKAFVGLISYHLTNNNGRIIADDFNYNAGLFNNCRLISGYINATRLPPLFKETLKQYYANSIISLGSEKNAGEEMNWLNWIPSGGTVVVSSDKGAGSYPKGTIVTNKTELRDIISLVYPVFPSFSDEAKERALTFISKMNPGIDVSTKGGKISNTLYTAEKGQPILIPLLKFISE